MFSGKMGSRSVGFETFHLEFTLAVCLPHVVSFWCIAITFLKAGVNMPLQTILIDLLIAFYKKTL